MHLLRKNSMPCLCCTRWVQHLGRMGLDFPFEWWETWGSERLRWLVEGHFKVQMWKKSWTSECEVNPESLKCYPLCSWEFWSLNQNPQGGEIEEPWSVAWAHSSLEAGWALAIKASHVRSFFCRRDGWCWGLTEPLPWAFPQVHFEKGMGRPTVGPAVPKTSMQIVDSAFLLSMDHLFPLAHFIFLFFLSYFFHCLPFLSFFSPPSLLSFFQFISTTGLFNISFRTLTLMFFLKVAYVC